MSSVDVLVIVDVEGALASKKLSNNVYLVDTDKFMGSYHEGGAELVTSVTNGETITWSITPVDPDTNVTIKTFNGKAIGHEIDPKPLSNGSWSAQATLPLNSKGQTYQYSINLQFEGGVVLGFDPFLLSAQS